MRNRDLLGRLVRLLLSRESRLLIPRRDITTGPDRTEETIPESEERLGKIGLDTPALVMNIVVTGVVGCHSLQGIPWQGVAAVIIDGFESRSSKEPHALPSVHASEFISNAGAKGVEQEALKGMII